MPGRGRMLLCAGMVFIFLIGVAVLFFQPVEAQGGSGGPGSAADPLLTRNSLKSYLDGLFAGMRQELDAATCRLDRVATGIQVLQGGIAASFPDMRGHSAEQAVNYLRNRGIISGYPDGNFYPGEGVTRATLVVMVVQAIESPPKAGSTGFPDVAAGHWAAGAIRAARDAGLVRGYPDGKYYPDRKVTRAEVAVVLNQAFQPAPLSAAVQYRDLQGHWAAKAIENLAAAGVFDSSADGCFHPDRIMTRAEIAVALARALSGIRF